MTRWQRNGRICKESGWKEYLKEATVMVDVEHMKDARAVDIIKAVMERIGEGRILAVRPKREYEITLEREDDRVFNRWINN